MKRAEQAKEFFLQGYACSQAVARAFADLTGVDRETLEKIMLPFGGGLGRQRLTCGAVSGACAVYGLLFAKSGVDGANKRDVYAGVRELCEKFKEKTGSIVCSELLAGMKVPVEIGGDAERRTKEYYQKRSCADMVALAAEILEDMLGNK